MIGIGNHSSNFQNTGSDSKLLLTMVFWIGPDGPETKSKMIIATVIDVTTGINMMVLNKLDRNLISLSNSASPRPITKLNETKMTWLNTTLNSDFQNRKSVTTVIQFVNPMNLVFSGIKILTLKKLLSKDRKNG